jgi:hypothetical protein
MDKCAAISKDMRSLLAVGAVRFAGMCCVVLCCDVLIFCDVQEDVSDGAVSLVRLPAQAAAKQPSTAEPAPPSSSSAPVGAIAAGAMEIVPSSVPASLEEHQCSQVSVNLDDVASSGKAAGGNAKNHEDNDDDDDDDDDDGSGDSDSSGSQQKRKPGRRRPPPPPASSHEFLTAAPSTLAKYGRACVRACVCVCVCEVLSRG